MKTGAIPKILWILRMGLKLNIYMNHSKIDLIYIFKKSY